MDKFLDLFFYPIFLWIILWGGGEGGNTPLVLREGGDAVNQYLGRGERKTVITTGGVEDEQLVEVNTTD